MNLAYRIGEMSRFNGIVLNSGCLSESEIRSPSDAAHLMVLARFPENKIPAVTKRNSTVGLVHAFNRQTGKCAIILKRKAISVADDLPPKKTAIHQSND